MHPFWRLLQPQEVEISLDEEEEEEEEEYPFSQPTLKFILRELEAYKVLTNMDDANGKLYVPLLYGLVVGRAEHTYFGVLLTYIDCVGTLKSVLTPETPVEDRNSWLVQVTETLEAMNRECLVWGDATPANVLIDTEGDAWIVDFRGGHSPGWSSERRWCTSSMSQLLKKTKKTMTAIQISVATIFFSAYYYASSSLDINTTQGRIPVRSARPQSEAQSPQRQEQPTSSTLLKAVLGISNLTHSRGYILIATNVIARFPLRDRFHAHGLRISPGILKRPERRDKMP
ncbi:uncharacterized protein BO97DRAFT_418946 [Aspergillus homomorphus CBS 101889]|uniref:Protein kinase domain-containing protein n=1 Tax=Aspergillus homomorphus (strain CBS 101889) TaxID=1450537 RepID=A0A395HJD7_ASPHC|nr:hypothetical protein BO97DRAFT_418946 [Aspergillus homomorphus CBS 101889]RAL07038.1 hypothetical protein BO97DRAFT_418946 [Aspergillus homomorphus CBS 101889]